MRRLKHLASTALAALLLTGIAGAEPEPDDPETHEAMTTVRQEELRSIERELRQLGAQADALSKQRDTLLRREVRSYLAHASAQGLDGRGGLEGVSLAARLTIVGLGTVGAEPGNDHAVVGDVDLDFSFRVTENLGFWIDLTANTNTDTDAHFPSRFGPIAGSAGATLSGLFDGIGVDGTVPTDPGSIRVSEAGIEWQAPVGDRTLHVLVGKLEPRDRFAQNRFAGDANRQFLNNLFDDPPAITWPTNSMGPTVYALHFWMAFGDNEEWRVDIGWYNGAGQFFNKGKFLWQVHWTGRLQDREINVRVYGLLDTALTDVGASVGVSADWWVTEDIGLFVRATVHDNKSVAKLETNHIESDWQIGALFHGFVPERPDDVIGIAWGLVKGPVRAVLPGATENSESVIEIFYRASLEGGKLEITPFAQFIIDPGAGLFEDDTLVLLGVRVFVPF